MTQEHCWHRRRDRSHWHRQIVTLMPPWINEILISFFSFYIHVLTKVTVSCVIIARVQCRILYIYYWIIQYIFLHCFHPFVSLTHLWPKEAHQANVKAGKAAREVLGSWIVKRCRFLVMQEFKTHICSFFVQFFSITFQILFFLSLALHVGNSIIHSTSFMYSVQFSFS